MEQRTKELEMAERLARLVKQQGGASYYVGGFVRDRVTGHESKDVDIEIHGISPAVLGEILDSLGQRITMGESFGIYALKGYELDIVMPRIEGCRGGRDGFTDAVDPFIGTKAACRRRDFTVNALMQDVLSGEIIDHFGGLEDIRRGILRHVDDVSFGEDPLRVLRAAQFAARLGYSIAEETYAVCRRLDITQLARERVEAELKKAVLKSAKPSVFFRELQRMGQLGVWFPELEALIGVEQPVRYHAEGDVWTHTMMVLDEAAKHREKAHNPYWFMLAALCHDFGKAVCTVNENGKIHAHGHEEAGLPLIDRFLHRLTREIALIHYVLNMAELHMMPITTAAHRSSVKATNRMFDRALDPEGLLWLALCDDRGRICESPVEGSEAFLRERLETFREYMQRPFVSGKELIEAGLEPGKNFSEILSYAHKLRLAGVPKDSAMKQTLAYARKLR